MPLILGLDASAAAIGVAILRDDTVLATETVPMQRGHAERLLPLVEQVLAAADIAIADLDAIGVTVGPGSFTGIRVGLSAARGLGFAIGRPVIGVTSLEVVARAAGPVGAGELLVLIDSKRADVFAQRFGPDGVALDAPCAVTRAALADYGSARPLHVVGDAAAIFPAEDGVTIAPSAPPDPALVARIAATRLDRPADFPPTPLYLRPPDAAPPAPGALAARMAVRP